MGSRTSKGSALDNTTGAGAKPVEAAATGPLDEIPGEMAMPSFKPIGRREARTPVFAETVAPAVASGSGASVRRSRSYLLLMLAAIFVIGVGTGLGGAYVAPLGLPLARLGIQDMQKTLFSRKSREGVPGTLLSSGGVSARASSASATALAREGRSAPERVSVEAPAKEDLAAALEPNPTIPVASPPAATAATGPGRANRSADVPKERAADRDSASTSLQLLDSATADRPLPAVAAREVQGSASGASAAASPGMGPTAMARAGEAMAQGDIITARRFYELAYSSGMPGAASGVGSTYDPLVLKESGVAGLKGDVDTARHWYEKAIAAGDAQAKPRLAKLLGLSATTR